MNKIIKITEDEIYVGKDDGSIIKTSKENAAWDVHVDDEVEIFSNENTIILSLAKKVKPANFGKKVSDTITKCCKLVLPIVFSSLFVLSLAVLIIINVVPRGQKYKYQQEIMGYGITSIIEFEEEEITVITYGNNGLTDGDEAYYDTMQYKIIDGNLYLQDKKTGEFKNSGKITSTFIEYEIEKVKIKYREESMITLRTISIIFTSIFAVLDAVAITLMILVRKKTKKAVSATCKRLSTDNEEIKN